MGGDGRDDDKDKNKKDFNPQDKAPTIE